MYDVIILGAGPAGLTAGIYVARAGLNTLLLEKNYAGGQMMATFQVDNYPGFESVSGAQLTSAMQAQVEKLGLSISSYDIQKIEIQPDKSIKLTHPKGEFLTHSLIVATGAHSRMLGCPGEERLRGRGVSYCAVCDGAFFKNEPLIVAGGGNSALDEAIFLTRFASKVIIVHRRDKLRADKIIQEHAFKNPKIEFLWDSVIEEILGDQAVSSVKIKNIKTSAITELPVKGVFVYVGMDSEAGLVKDLVKTDENGFIITNEDMATSAPGIFAAGDVRSKKVRQIATAVGDGTIAAIMAEKYAECFH